MYKLYSQKSHIPASLLSMQDWVEIAFTLQEACVLIMVIEHKGSAPREKHSWLLASKNHFYGTLGGGNLEWQALDAARSLLQKPSHMRL